MLAGDERAAPKNFFYFFVNGEKIVIDARILLSKTNDSQRNRSSSEFVLYHLEENVPRKKRTPVKSGGLVVFPKNKNKINIVTLVHSTCGAVFETGSLRTS